MATDKKISELNSASSLSGVEFPAAQSGDNVKVAASVLQDRANHTGSQTASTISDFTTAVEAIVGGSGNFFDKNTDDSDDITEGVTNLFMTSAEKTKLSGIASGATANQTDAYLLDRANHTGTQLAATISDFSTAADARISTAIGVTVQAYDADLTAWAGVNPSDYSTTATIAANYQPLDADLTSWAGITRASGFDTFATTPTSANLRALMTDETGTGANYFQGGDLGTPSAGVLTNATGLPLSTGISGFATGMATFLGTPSSANLAATVTDETGSGSLVFATSPTLVTPALGTPSSVTLTNATGLPISTGVSGLGTGVATFLATPSSANLRAALTDEVGTGAAYFVGGALGTPASGTLTNATGLPISTGVSGLGIGVATFLATPSSANLASALTDETGSGAAVFASSPALSGTPTAPTAAGGTNTTQIATTAFVTSAVAGIATGWTSLGTITTTSGTSQSLSSLTLTNYKFLKCVLNGVSGTNSSTNITQNSNTIGILVTNAGAVRGVFEVDLASGVSWWNTGGTANTTATTGGASSGVTTASTSITFAISAGTFDAGSISVYAI